MMPASRALIRGGQVTGETQIFVKRSQHSPINKRARQFGVKYVFVVGHIAPQS
jgi:hypothetical protein